MCVLSVLSSLFLYEYRIMIGLQMRPGCPEPVVQCHPQLEFVVGLTEVAGEGDRKEEGWEVPDYSKIVSKHGFKPLQATFNPDILKSSQSIESLQYKRLE